MRIHSPQLTQTLAPHRVQEFACPTIAENLQRQDLHPLEEAATIQQAFDRGYDAKAVAARLGKSVVHIARRASLTKLCKEWRDEVLKAETEASRLSVAHLELVARLPEETQRILAENNFHRVFARGFPTVEELRRVIDAGLQSLRAMPWALEDDTLDPKAGWFSPSARPHGPTASTMTDPGSGTRNSSPARRTSPSWPHCTR